MDAVPDRPAKRALDVTLAVLLFVLLAPLFGLALGAIALGRLRAADRGPLLYREPRISRGRPFDLLKFRTLRADVLARSAGEEPHARLLEADHPANLTWAGRHALKTVVPRRAPAAGERPPRRHEPRRPTALATSMVERQLAAGVDYRRNAVAGWNGPVQVCKGIAEPEHYTALDLRYVEACRTWSALELVRYDLVLLWRTVKVLARGDGLRY